MGRSVGPGEPSPIQAARFLDDILDITEDGSTFRSIALSESEVYSFRFSLHTATKAHEMLGRAINQFRAGNQGAQDIRSGPKR